MDLIKPKEDSEDSKIDEVPPRFDVSEDIIQFEVNILNFE